MKFEDIDLSEMPQNFAFSKLVDQQFYLWEKYEPTTIEADFPFEQDWWKYLYWMPKIKKEFYTLALSALDMEKDLQKKANDMGMDYWFFTRHYGDFLKRLEWMRKQGINYAGECI